MSRQICPGQGPVFVGVRGPSIGMLVLGGDKGRDGGLYNNPLYLYHTLHKIPWMTGLGLGLIKQP